MLNSTFFTQCAGLGITRQTLSNHFNVPEHELESWLLPEPPAAATEWVAGIAKESTDAIMGSLRYARDLERRGEKDSQPLVLFDYASEALYQEAHPNSGLPWGVYRQMIQTSASLLMGHGVVVTVLTVESSQDIERFS